jgi:hypothetical protein
MVTIFVYLSKPFGIKADFLVTELYELLQFFSLSMGSISKLFFVGHFRILVGQTNKTNTFQELSAISVIDLDYQGSR